MILYGMIRQWMADTKEICMIVSQPVSIYETSLTNSGKQLERAGGFCDKIRVIPM